MANNVNETGVAGVASNSSNKKNSDNKGISPSTEPTSLSSTLKEDVGIYRWKNDDDLTTIVGLFNKYINYRKQVDDLNAITYVRTNVKKVRELNVEAINTLCELINLVIDTGTNRQSYEPYNLLVDLSKDYIDTYMAPNKITQGIQYIKNMDDVKRCLCVTNIIANIHNNLTYLPAMNDPDTISEYSRSYHFSAYVIDKAYADPKRMKFKNA